jgi:hypothetical protein
MKNKIVSNPMGSVTFIKQDENSGTYVVETVKDKLVTVHYAVNYKDKIFATFVPDRLGNVIVHALPEDMLYVADAIRAQYDTQLKYSTGMPESLFLHKALSALISNIHLMSMVQVQIITPDGRTVDTSDKEMEEMDKQFHDAMNAAQKYFKQPCVGARSTESIRKQSELDGKPMEDDEYVSCKVFDTLVNFVDPKSKDVKEFPGVKNTLLIDSPHGEFLFVKFDHLKDIDPCMILSQEMAQKMVAIIV